MPKLQRPQFFPLSTNNVDGTIRPELHFDHPLVVGMQPLLDYHGVVGDLSFRVVSQFLLPYFQLPSLSVLELDHPVSCSSTQNWDEGEEDACVDVDQFVSLKEGSVQGSRMHFGILLTSK